MFTGLIEQIATVTRTLPGQQGQMTEITIQPDTFFVPEHGESIAINGICLTVANLEATTMTFQVSSETIDRTNFSTLKQDSRVNLERSLKLETRLGGHLVSGHVDTAATIEKVNQGPQGVLVEIRIPTNHAELVVSKGSICLDGTSLTINSVEDDAEGTTVSVMLIPTTLQNTILSQWQAGSLVNVEFDMLGKYILRRQDLEIQKPKS
jgi:riboflavin synthase